MIRRITATVILLVIAAVPGLLAADSETEYEISEGYFYTQGNGLESSVSEKGYRLTNEDNISFFSEFNRLGGVPALGYPISRRFNWEGRTTQLTQRAMLQWDDVQGKVIVFDIFDYLSDGGWDNWLEEHESLPKQLLVQGSEEDLNPAVLKKARLKLLDEDPQIKAYYLSTAAAGTLYGLPTSKAEDLGTFVVMRFQRTALQRWKVATEWASEGDVTPVNAGEIAKELGIPPDSAMEPEDAPEPAPRRAMASSRGTGAITRGIATWYGADFHGLEMRNGEIYNMYDPTTAASNSHPLGTRLRVTSVATGKSVIVRVTDTGAFRYPILVDLSWAAFSQIANPSSGIVDITVEPLRDQ